MNLPSKVNIHCEKVYDQGELGAATACAIASMVEYLITNNKEIEFIYFEVRNGINT